MIHPCRLFPIVIKHTYLATPSNIWHSRLFSSTSLSNDSDQTVILAAVSILKHHRSKSRWTHLRSVFPNGFQPSEVSKVILQLRNNPHLALRFFQFTVQHSLCNHSLVSFCTIIHILSRARQKSNAQTLIQTAMRKFEDTHDPSLSSSSSRPKIFEALIRTYRTCDSAPFVFDLLIEACLQAKRIDQSIEIVRMLRSKYIYPTISTCNSLIRLVSKCHGCYAGYDMYREVFRFDGEVVNGNGGNVKMVAPNAHTFNTIMLAFYRDGLMKNVEEVWGEMGVVKCAPNAYSYSIMMEAYCEDGRIREAMSVWEEMEINDVKHDVVAYNTIIGGFCKIGEVGRAEEFFREMEMSGLEGTCVTFEHLIYGYCKIGDVQSALLLYKDMCRKDFRPESSTVDAVIRLLSEKSRVTEALEFLKVAIRKHSIIPKGKSYEFLIKGLCQEGRMEDALKLQAEMVGKGYGLNSEIYSVFIDGYMKEGNTELADKLEKEMLETQKAQDRIMYDI